MLLAVWQFGMLPSTTNGTVSSSLSSCRRHRQVRMHVRAHTLNVAWQIGQIVAHARIGLRFYCSASKIRARLVNRLAQRVFGFDWIFNTRGCDVWELGICRSDCWEMFRRYLLNEWSLSASFPRGRAFRYIAHTNLTPRTKFILQNSRCKTFSKNINFE